MNLELKETDSVKRELSGELTIEELKPYFEKAYLKYKKKAQIPGFRKGKIPLEMIKKLYGQSIEYSSLEEIIDDVFKNYIREKNIDLIGNGSITDMDYKPGDNFTFKVEFEVMPEFELSDYKGLEISRTKNIIEESLIDDEINYHRLRLANLELDGEALDDEYLVTIDIQELDEKGNLLIGKNQKDVKIYLNSPDIEASFKEGLTGLKENEERIIDVTEKNGDVRKLKVKCLKVEKIVQPELDQQFFKLVTGKEDIENIEAFRELIKSELQKIYDNTSEQEVRNNIIDELIRINDISVPDKLVNIYLNAYAEDYKKRNADKKLPENFEEEFKKHNKVDAIKHAKWSLIKDKIVQKEDIQVNDQDFLKIAKENSEKYNIPEEKLIDIYKKNESIKNKILEDKIIEKLLSEAKINEKEVLRDSHKVPEHEHEH